MPLTMFEGKPPILPLGGQASSGDSSADELCALSWSDLKAKLAAARDLREVIVEDENGAIASFDADSARRLAAISDRPEDDGKRPVNPHGLGNSKANGRMDVAPAAPSEPDARGST